MSDDRRTFLKEMSALSATTVLASGTAFAAAEETAPARDYYKEIGVKPFINAAAAYSAYGGRNMWPAVVEAMGYARKSSNRRDVSSVEPSSTIRISKP